MFIRGINRLDHKSSSLFCIQPTQVCLRAPVSESLSRLHREQLQKFAQYLISELPQQILPTAQRLLDELLSVQPSTINSYCGAPDPTAGASAHDQTSWYLDEKTLHDNIKKILIKFCVPAPIVFRSLLFIIVRYSITQVYPLFIVVSRSLTVQFYFRILQWIR